MLIRDAFAWQEGRDAAISNEQRVVPSLLASNEDAAKAWLAGYDDKPHPAANALVPMHLGGADLTAAEYLEAYDQWGRRRK